MRVRYVAVSPIAEGWWDKGPLLPTVNVFESDVPPKDTGLLNSNGTKLYRIQERDQVGFIRQKKQ